MRSRFERLAVSLIALIGVLLLPSNAAAKVTCTDPLDARTRTLAGLPASPAAGETYHASILTSTRHGANPEPLLMFVQCVGGEDRHFAQFTPEQPGGGAVRSGFAVRFERTGHWMGVLMDRSGRFFNLGSYEVGAAAAAPVAVEGDEGVPAGLVIGLGLGVCAVAGAAATLGRRRVRSA